MVFATGDTPMRMSFSSEEVRRVGWPPPPSFSLNGFVLSLFFLLLAPPCHTGHTSSHVGNVRHNDLVFALVEQLIANDGAASLADIDSIRGEIRRTGGRYMGRDASTGVWTELGEEESRDKVDQAIRSRISWFRKEGRPDRPIREIDALQDNDFRLGRGMTSPAIDRFHEMMDQWVPYYWRATRKAKSKIRALLLLSWRQQEPPGRFVKTSTFHGKMVLHELGDDARQIQALPIKYLTRKTSNLKGTLDIDEAKVEELQLVFNDAIGGPATIHRETVGQTHTDPSFPTSQLSSPTCTDKYVYCWVSPEVSSPMPSRENASRRRKPRSHPSLSPRLRKIADNAPNDTSEGRPLPEGHVERRQETSRRRHSRHPFRLRRPMSSKEAPQAVTHGTREHRRGQAHKRIEISFRGFRECQETAASSRCQGVQSHQLQFRPSYSRPHEDS